MEEQMNEDAEATQLDLAAMMESEFHVAKWWEGGYDISLPVLLWIVVLTLTALGAGVVVSSFREVVKWIFHIDGYGR